VNSASKYMYDCLTLALFLSIAWENWSDRKEAGECFSFDRSQPYLYYAPHQAVIFDLEPVSGIEGLAVFYKIYRSSFFYGLLLC